MTWWQKVLCLCHYGPALLTFWFQKDLGRENSASYLKLQAGKTDAFHLSHHSQALVTLYVHFYVLIGQNLTGEFMQKIYTASCNLFTLTAKADSVFCQLVMILTVFFHWMHKMKYSCYQQSSVVHGWFVFWIFGWDFGWHRFRFLRFSHRWMRVEKSQAILALLDGFQELHLEW